jgi:ATP-dependent protease ClpP protease subunit
MSIKSNVESIHSYGLDVKNRVIYVNSEDYGDYGSETGETGVDFAMASKFIRNLDYLNSLSNEPILVKTLNCGGCWFYGTAMYDAIKMSEAPVDIHARAWARSMSSIILQAGRTRILSEHTVFMVHYGEYGDSGDFRKVKSGMEFYTTLNKTMFDIYADRCYGAPAWGDSSKEEIADAIEDRVRRETDWWLTADEALNYGFCDKIERKK